MDGQGQTHDDSIYRASIASRDKMGHMTLTTPLLGCFVILRLEFAVINTIFEVAISSSDEDTKGDTKCRKMGGFSYLGWG